MKKFLSVFIFVWFIGCGVNSTQIVIEDSSQFETRTYQTRNYDYPKNTVAKASVAAVQDLNFIIDKADLETGTLTATRFKQGSTMKITLVIRDKEKGKSVIRANAQFKSGSYPPTAVDDPEVYNSFFKVLDKALFFENENL